MKNCQWFKPISISLSPNVEKDDISLAFKLLFKCWKWKKGKAVSDLEYEFKQYLGSKYVFALNSGRSCLITILESLNLKKGSEVLVQAFTCNAAINPIIWSGLKPVYVDCDENTFNIDVDDLKKKITSNTKVIIVQHTFGLSANMGEVMKIVQENNLILIEDCAHSLGAEYNGKKVGTFGHASFFSFSRDKIISSVYGGMIAVNDSKIGEKIEKDIESVKYPNNYWVFQQLLHPVLMSLILPIYNFLKIGKGILILSQWFHILSKAVHWKEKQGQKPSYFPKRMPNALAILALNQFQKLDRFNNHRKEISNYYFDNLIDLSFDLPQNLSNSKHVFLRFSVKHNKAHQIIEKAWKHNLLIGDWYTSPVAPHDTRLDTVQYVSGSCPKAEKLSKITFNLPTHINISEEQAQKIIDFLKEID